MRSDGIGEAQMATVAGRGRHVYDHRSYLCARRTTWWPVDIAFSRPPWPHRPRRARFPVCLLRVDTVSCTTRNHLPLHCCARRSDRNSTTLARCLPQPIPHHLWRALRHFLPVAPSRVSADQQPLFRILSSDSRTVWRPIAPRSPRHCEQGSTARVDRCQATSTQVQASTTYSQGAASVAALPTRLPATAAPPLPLQHPRVNLPTWVLSRPASSTLRSVWRSYARL